MTKIFLVTKTDVLLTEEGGKLSLGDHVMHPQVRIIVVIAACDLGVAREDQLQEAGLSIRVDYSQMRTFYCACAPGFLPGAWRGV